MPKTAKLFSGLAHTALSLDFGPQVGLSLGMIFMPSERYLQSVNPTEKSDSISIGLYAIDGFFLGLDPDMLVGTTIGFNCLFADMLDPVVEAGLSPMFTAAISRLHMIVIDSNDAELISQVLNGLADKLIEPIGKTESIDLIDFFKSQVGKLEDARITADPAIIGSIALANFKTVLETRRSVLMSATSKIEQLEPRRRHDDQSSGAEIAGEGGTELKTGTDA